MKHQPEQVRERFAVCFVGDVVISAITLAELEFGVACHLFGIDTGHQQRGRFPKLYRAYCRKLDQQPLIAGRVRFAHAVPSLIGSTPAGQAA